MQTRPRLLHVFSTFAVGGPQKRFAQLAGATQALFRHSVLAVDGNYEARRLLPPGVEIVAAVSNAGALPARLARYRTYLRKTRPDLLVTYNWGAIEWALAGRLTFLPLIHVEDGFGLEEASRQLRRRAWLRRLVLSGARAVVVPSRTLLAIAQHAWGLAPARLRYIPNGIMTRLSEAHAADAPAAGGRLTRATLGLPDDAAIIGWAGTLRREKNLARLLHAFARQTPRPAPALALVGDGPERPALESLARTLGIAARVHFLGTRADVERILPLFDIFALSSDTEQMPLAVLEAMQAGLPIAAVDVGDVRAMVAAANRPFIVERSEPALATALAALLAEPALRRRIGAANRAHAAAFSFASMVEAYTELFRSSVPAARGARPGIEQGDRAHYHGRAPV